MIIELQAPFNAYHLAIYDFIDSQKCRVEQVLNLLNLRYEPYEFVSLSHDNALITTDHQLQEWEKSLSK